LAIESNGTSLDSICRAIGTQRDRAPFAFYGGDSNGFKPGAAEGGGFKFQVPGFKFQVDRTAVGTGERLTVEPET